jgi:hypothetical protein
MPPVYTLYAAKAEPFVSVVLPRAKRLVSDRAWYRFSALFTLLRIFSDGPVSAEVCEDRRMGCLGR